MYQCNERFRVQWRICDTTLHLAKRKKGRLSCGLFDVEDVCYYTNEEMRLCGEKPVARNLNNMMNQAKGFVEQYISKRAVWSDDEWHWELGWDSFGNCNVTWLYHGKEKMYRLSIEWRMLNERE